MTLSAVSEEKYSTLLEWSSISRNKFMDDLLEEYKGVTSMARLQRARIYLTSMGMLLYWTRSNSLVAKLLYGSKRVRANILTALLHTTRRRYIV